MKTGELLVRRPDADELIAIKRGEWPLEKVKAEADKLFDLALEAYVNSKLPERPDAEAVNRLCCEVVSLALRARGGLPCPKGRV